MELAKYKLPNIELLQSSHARAMAAATRLFAFSDTKWTDFLLPGALAQLDEDVLALAINLRRVLEANKQKASHSIVPHFIGHSGREKGDYDQDLWRVLGRIVHHQVIEPNIIKDADFFGNSSTGPIAGYLVTDISITSDYGTSIVDVAGFAMAAANELGISYQTLKTE